MNGTIAQPRKASVTDPRRSAEPQSVELFAGGGGMALGMREAGFKHSALVEWWAPAARVLRHNGDIKPDLWKPADVIEADVRLSFDKLGEEGTVQLVAAGPPCQPFSLGGAHAGDADDRNQFPTALDAVRKLRPEIVIFENVPGLLRPSFIPYVDYVKAQLRHPDITTKNGGELWHEHYARIKTSKAVPAYRVYQEMVNAADLGVPQSRMRVFIIGIRADVSGADTWEKITISHSRDTLLYDQYVSGRYWDRHNLPPQEIPVRLATVVKRLQAIGPPATAPWQTLREALLPIPEPGQGIEVPLWPNHLLIPGARTYAKHSGSPLDMPSKTIKAGVHGVAGGEAMLRDLDGSVRYLTVRESAVVQGFPQNYEFPGVRSRVMGVIGNAVATRVAATLGLALRKHTGI